MTTAHRPTWNTASGSSNQGGWNTGGQISMQFSARDLPGHTKLKFRQYGQGTIHEIALRDLKAELEQKELLYNEERLKDDQFTGESLRKLRDTRRLLLKANPNDSENIEKQDHLEEIAKRYDDTDDISHNENIIEEDDDNDGSSSSNDSSSDESDDSDDDEEELMRELEKIKREKEEQREKEEAERLKQQKNKNNEEILIGNPLVSMNTNAAIKRKWNDDVVFKNQSRGEKIIKKRFINDTIRNDFHRRFLNRYIK